MLSKYEESIAGWCEHTDGFLWFPTLLACHSVGCHSGTVEAFCFRIAAPVLPSQPGMNQSHHVLAQWSLAWQGGECVQLVSMWAKAVRMCSLIPWLWPNCYRKSSWYNAWWSFTWRLCFSYKNTSSPSKAHRQWAIRSVSDSQHATVLPLTPWCGRGCVQQLLSRAFSHSRVAGKTILLLRAGEALRTFWNR